MNFSEGELQSLRNVSVFHHEVILHNLRIGNVFVYNTLIQATR